MSFGLTNPGGKIRAIGAELGNYSAGNYLNVDINGQIRLFGEAAQWDDFSVPLSRDKQGQNEKPDYDFNEHGLLFPQNDTSEAVHLVAQMSHKKQIQTSIHLHIHYRQTSVNKPVFTVEYRFYNNGEAIPTSWTTINTSDEGGNTGIIDYTTGSIINIGTFPLIAAPLSEIVSANLDIKLYRNDNIVTGDVLAKYIDFHFLTDTLGSAEEFQKFD